MYANAGEPKPIIRALLRYALGKHECCVTCLWISAFRFEFYILRVAQERNDLPRTFDGLLSEHPRCYSSFVCVPSDRGMAVRTEVTLSHISFWI